MLCVVIKGPTLQEAEMQIREAMQHAELVEWRLDYFENHSQESLAALKKKFSIRTIFTLRPVSQGGKWEASEDSRLARIEQLARLHPTFLDLEHTVPGEFIDRIKRVYPDIKVILSRHDFEKTPSTLLDVKEHPADFYKHACIAHSALDTYRLLIQAKFAPKNHLLMTMGPTGHLSRILAPVVGRPFTYASLSDELQVVPGQISAKELKEIYSYDKLTPSTVIYGLIGEVVDKSVSHISHNEVMRQFQLPGVYVKTAVRPHELKEFLQLAKKLGVRGLSVTTPLKEHVLEYCDILTPDAKAIGAVNTLAFVDGAIMGYNADAPGALDAIEEHMKVAGKQVVIIGAGGAAKAVAWQAKERGADVLVCNRNKERASALAEHIGCRAGSLDEVGRDYSIIINATSVPMPIEPDAIIPGCLAMDLRTLPKDTLFMQEAKLKGCSLVYGYEMFIKQAVVQFTIWFKHLDPTKVEQVLASAVKKTLGILD